jgi:hypothetical protein
MTRDQAYEDSRREITHISALFNSSEEQVCTCNDHQLDLQQQEPTFVLASWQLDQPSQPIHSVAPWLQEEPEFHAKYMRTHNLETITIAWN